MNADGKLDVEDLKLLQVYLIGKKVTFPAGIRYTPISKEEYNGQKTLTGSRLYEYLDLGWCNGL